MKPAFFHKKLSNGPQYSIKSVLLIYLGWWILWAFIQTIVLHRLGLTWQLSALDSAVFILLLALSCMIAILLFRYYQPGPGNRIFRLVFAISVTILFCNSFKWVMNYLVPVQEDYQKFLEASMPIRFVFSLLLLSFVIIINWIWNFVQQQSGLEKRKAEAARLVNEAELVQLRQQLQPHFLFNSLNSISALVGKPQEARKMIQQLSDFLRGTIRKDEKQLITLNEELEHLHLYLEIEKVRFGDRLNVETDVPEQLLQTKVPPLILQPIVENAIKFGLYGTLDKITVSITASGDQFFLNLVVKNPCDEVTQQSGRGTGFGLTSVQRRLFLLYARNDLLATENDKFEFVTKLKIPQA